MKNRIKTTIFCIILLTVTMMLSGCTSTDTDDYEYMDDYFKTYTVTYKIDGPPGHTVDVTMENQDGGTSQYTDEPLPFTYKLYGMREGDFVYISGQVNDNACIIAEIYLDDVRVKHSQSCGEYVIATCSGRI